jgi:hypothetical protein
MVEKLKRTCLRLLGFLKRSEEGDQACPELYGITVWVFEIAGGVT